ncbi:MAG: hypothetical protein KKC79_09380 [Gammaproteobacteria bacterium]|nr:hypothetical protein [Gammaproteobacteria bacterium]MBU1442795.1 hypothetical protein [Gammaproteobacteria bacterium]MBU2286069.1 hypothetical protein [Gammaproteobacteria bacterium]MBU2408845.1 hypothetical protein [Gammaproteobacteria bacterium]
MAEFFKTSQVWVVDFRYDGRARRWFKSFRTDDDVPASMTATLRDLYGDRARLVAVRRATQDEELQYVRGALPKNMHCPTGRGPVG